MSIAGTAVRLLNREISKRVAEVSVLTSGACEGTTGPRVMIIPSESRWVGSSMFWGWDVGQELRRLGWRVSILPPELDLNACRRLVGVLKPDVLFFVKCRRTLMRPEFFPGVPCVFLLDDADYEIPDRKDRVIDCCRTSKFIIAGNEEVGNWCAQYNENVQVVWTSHPVPARRPELRPVERGPVVAWAHGNPFGYPIESKLIQEVIVALGKEQSFEFRLYGVVNDEQTRQFIEPMLQSGVRVCTVPYVSRYTDYLDSLSDVAVGLHPVCLENPFSKGKSFGKALSYMAADVAVVTTHALDHVQFFQHGVNGMLVENDIGIWKSAIAQLLREPQLRQSIVDQAYRNFVARLSTPVAAAKLDDVLRRVIT